MNVLPLFEVFPKLRSSLPYIELCDLPTPIQPLKSFGRRVNHERIFIKRDDLSGNLFGGNKVRTLEFLLKIASSNKENIVLGLPGTSMALATNIYAHKLDIPIKTILFNQKATSEAQKNLLYFQYLRADLVSTPLITDKSGTLNFKSILQDYPDAIIIDPNSPTGMCGHINAAIELKKQVDEGNLPEPDYLYLPMGLMGTATGLIIGLKAVGLDTQVVCCYIQPVDDSGLQAIKERICTLFTQATDYLQQLDHSFPKLELASPDIEIRSPPIKTTSSHREKPLAWIQEFFDLEGIKLDATWTGQAIASLVDDIEHGYLEDQVVLYWHTFNSRPYPKGITDIDYHHLPAEFWHYFEAEELAVINKPVIQE